jgi:16S rRNA (uracil1498-N3)-methyltransferase
MRHDRGASVTEPLLRLFVPPGSCDAGVLRLEGDEAARIHGRGARDGDTIVALDDSGWAMTVVLDRCAATACDGRVTGRALAPERRTKVGLYQGLLHPSDFRRLLARATRLGVVEFVPVITDSSVVPSLGADGWPEGEADWPRLVRDAAEAAGRGRRPVLRQPMLFDHALDEALRAGAVVLVDPGGEGIESLLAARPFSINVFCPPPAGYTAEERARARARGVAVARPPGAGSDPIQPALGALEVIYARLDGFAPGAVAASV